MTDNRTTELLPWQSEYFDGKSDEFRNRSLAHMTHGIGGELDGYSQKAVKVEAVGYENVVVRSNTKGGYGYHDGAYPLLLWSAASTAHVKPDPLVELLRGFAGRVDSLSWFGLDTFDEAVTEYAERIRELTEVDR